MKQLFKPAYKGQNLHDFLQGNDALVTATTQTLDPQGRMRRADPNGNQVLTPYDVMSQERSNRAGSGDFNAVMRSGSTQVSNSGSQPSEMTYAMARKLGAGNHKQARAMIARHEMGINPATGRSYTVEDNLQLRNQHLKASMQDRETSNAKERSLLTGYLAGIGYDKDELSGMSVPELMEKKQFETTNQARIQMQQELEAQQQQQAQEAAFDNMMQGLSEFSTALDTGGQLTPYSPEAIATMQGQLETPGMDTIMNIYRGGGDIDRADMVDIMGRAKPPEPAPGPITFQATPNGGGVIVQDGKMKGQYGAPAATRPVNDGPPEFTTAENGQQFWRSPGGNWQPVKAKGGVDPMDFMLMKNQMPGASAAEVIAALTGKPVGSAGASGSAPAKSGNAKADVLNRLGISK